MAAHSEFDTERSQDDPIETELEDETPGDYAPHGHQSPDTGVTYEPSGEPEQTPHDLEVTLAEDEETP